MKVANRVMYDPFEAFQKISDLWEKQLNHFLSLYSANCDLENLSKKNNDTQMRTLELFRKNQEVLASILNIPTKSDLAQLANRNRQTEETLESLETQLWELHDSVNSTNKDIESVIEVSKEIIKLTKQLKSELLKTKKQLADTKDLQKEIVEMKKELTQLNTFKEEIEILKTLIDKGDAQETALAAPTGKAK
jgi:dGTP triphosphohydrolase